MNWLDGTEEDINPEGAILSNLGTRFVINQIRKKIKNEK